MKPAAIMLLSCGYARLKNSHLDKLESGNELDIRL